MHLSTLSVGLWVMLVAMVKAGPGNVTAPILGGTAVAVDENDLMSGSLIAPWEWTLEYAPKQHDPFHGGSVEEIVGKIRERNPDFEDQLGDLEHFSELDDEGDVHLDTTWDVASFEDHDVFDEEEAARPDDGKAWGSAENAAFSRIKRDTFVRHVSKSPAAATSTSHPTPAATPAIHPTIRCKGLFSGARVDKIRRGFDYLRTLPGKAKVAPGSCARVSCSWGAGIYVCNTNSKTKEVSWEGVIHDANSILLYCGLTFKGRSSGIYTREDGNTSVIIRGTSYKC